MRIPLNYVLIKPHDHFDKLKVGDKELLLDTSYEKGYHAISSGTVVAVPEKLYFERLHPSDSDDQIRHKHTYSLRFDTDMELEPDDEVVFHYHAVKDAISATRVHEGNYFIRYDGIFVRLRGGVVYPINGIILSEAMKEKIDTTLIIPETANTEREIESVVRYIGMPNRQYLHDPHDADTNEIQVGDIIVHKDLDKINIQFPTHQIFDRNHDIFRMTRRDIFAVVDQERVWKHEVKKSLFQSEMEKGVKEFDKEAVEVGIDLDYIKSKANKGKGTGRKCY